MDFDEMLVEAGQDGFQRQEFARVVVHHEDADLVRGVHALSAPGDTGWSERARSRRGAAPYRPPWWRSPGPAGSPPCLPPRSPRAAWLAAGRGEADRRIPACGGAPRRATMENPLGGFQARPGWLTTRPTTRRRRRGHTPLSDLAVQPRHTIEVIIAGFVWRELDGLLGSQADDAEHGQTFIQQRVDPRLERSVEVDHHVTAQDDVELVERTVRHQVVLCPRDVL